MPAPRKPKHICIIRPDIWADDSFNELSCRAKLLWLGLAGFLDCQGRAVFDPDRIAAEIFPAQTVPFHDLFEELQIMDLIELYQVDGVTYLQMTDFPRHQRQDKRRASRLPDRDGHVAERVTRKTEERKNIELKEKPPAAGDSSPDPMRVVGVEGVHPSGPTMEQVAAPKNTSRPGSMTGKRIGGYDPNASGGSPLGGVGLEAPRTTKMVCP